MKTIKTLLLTLCISVMGFAQNGINYKAIIKDGSGNILANQSVDVQFIIYEGAALTNNVYQESHPANTDANGIIVVSIGEGNTSDVFADVAWGADEHWLNVQVDTGAGLVDMGTTQFMAVPYALSSSDNYWSKNGNDIYTSNNEVGINSTNPEHTLDVRSSSQAEPAGINLSNSDKSRNLRFFSGSEAFPDPSMTWVPGRSLLFASFDDNALIFNEYMRISSEGDVGIGVTDPQATLDINGGIKADSFDVSSGVIRNVADPILAQDAATKAYVDATTSPAYTIGLSAEQGGYIFWVSTDGKHGLVAATFDQSISSNWYAAQDSISNPSNHSVDGCNFRDWRLPTKFELIEMYLQRNDIGGFSTGNYWSSTEWESRRF